MTALCVAPLDDETLCCAEAVTTRLVEGLECPLCAEHAAEMDEDTAADETAAHVLF